MSIEFIGIAATAPHRETEIAPGQEQAGPAQAGCLEELARAHEEAGFDRVLVAHSSASRTPVGAPGAAECALSA